MPILRYLFKIESQLVFQPLVESRRWPIYPKMDTGGVVEDVWEWVWTTEARGEPVRRSIEFWSGPRSKGKDRDLTAPCGLPVARWRHCSTSSGLPVAITRPAPPSASSTPVCFVWMEFEMVETWTFILDKFGTKRTLQYDKPDKPPALGR